MAPSILLETAQEIAAGPGSARDGWAEVALFYGAAVRQLEHPPAGGPPPVRLDPSEIAAAPGNAPLPEPARQALAGHARQLLTCQDATGGVISDAATEVIRAVEQAEAHVGPGAKCCRAS